MVCSSKLLNIIESLKVFLNDPNTKEKFRSNSNDFIRKSGKLDFVSYCLLCLSLLKQSLSVELYNLLTVNELSVISKSAYSQYRYKISPCFYQSWNDLLISLIYESNNSDNNSSDVLFLKHWKGYNLEAVDGTSVVLPQTQELSNHFGSHRNGTKNGKITDTVMCRCLLRVDLLNEHVLNTQVARIIK